MLIYNGRFYNRHHSTRATG